MSNFASNNNAKIGLIKETILGTTPATPSLTAQRFATANFTVARDEITDPSKTGARQQVYTQVGNVAVTGTLSAPLAHNNYDTLFESALFNTFAANELIIGNTPVSLSIEEGQPDAATPVYRLFKGMIVNGFSIASPTEGLTTVDFDFVGLNAVIDDESVDADDAYTAQAVRQPFVTCGGVIREGGVDIGYVNSVNLSYTNNLEAAQVWGACSAEDIIPGNVEITGSLGVFLRDATLLNKFLTNTESSLLFTLSDGTNTLTFNLPRIKYTAADAPLGDGSRIVELSFRALYDAVEGSSIVITRSA